MATGIPRHGIKRSSSGVCSVIAEYAARLCALAEYTVQLCALAEYTVQVCALAEYTVQLCAIAEYTVELCALAEYAVICLQLYNKWLTIFRLSHYGVLK